MKRKPYSWPGPRPETFAILPIDIDAQPKRFPTLCAAHVKGMEPAPGFEIVNVGDCFDCEACAEAAASLPT